MPPTGVEAIVVGRHDLGESDRIVRLLTAGQGRVDVVARGARASRKRFGGALDLGTRVVVRWRVGRGSMPTLEAADVIAAPKRVRDSYERVVLLAYGCDVLATLSEHGLEGPRGFGLLGAFLTALEDELEPTVATRVALEAKALTFAGIAPQLVVCPSCGERLEGEVRFDPEAGGGVHMACGQGPVVEAADLLRLEGLRRTPVAETPGLEVAPTVRWLLTDFIEYHARRALQTRALLTTARDV